MKGPRIEFAIRVPGLDERAKEALRVVVSVDELNVTVRAFQGSTLFCSSVTAAARFELFFQHRQRIQRHFSPRRLLAVPA